MTLRKSLWVLFLSLGALLHIHGQDKPGPTAEELAKSNNPLADIKAFNVQNYYIPRLFGNSDAIANTTWLRGAIPTGRILWRGSLPFQTFSTGSVTESGLGDADIFGAYLAVQDTEFTFGVGPSIGIPTASNDFLGTGKWTGGLAAVVFAMPSPQFQYGALVIWRTSFAGDDNRADVNFGAFQPFYFWQLGKGLYLRGAPIWFFDIETGNYNVPVALGIGKVLKVGGTVFNLFFEPQFTALHYGAGQPAIQLFSGINMQF